MSEVARQFGSNVREARKEKSISQDKLALLADIDRSYMGRIERGEVSLTIDMICKIAQALQCQPGALMPEISDC